jgi:glutamate-5-semialdehyde dehydrogenase
VNEMISTRDTMLALGRAARAAQRKLALASSAQKNQALLAMAAEVRAAATIIASENAGDVAQAREKGLKASFIDRLTLTPERIEAMAKGLEDIAALADPVGAVTEEWARPNGMKIARVRVPIGVIGIIYESRPNVTADAGALTMKSGNAAILRGGSDGFRSSVAIVAALQRGLIAAGLPAEVIQMVPGTDRSAVDLMLEGQVAGCQGAGKRARSCLQPS